MSGMVTLTPAAQLLYATLRLETDVGIGTAFLVSHSWEAGQGVFLVTNKHVVEGATTGSVFLTAAANAPPAVTTPRTGDRIDVRWDSLAGIWHPHPQENVDVTVAPFANVLNLLGEHNRRPFFRTIPTSMFATAETLADLNVTQDVFFVGYPSGIFDRVNLLPLFRRGMIASPPGVDYEGLPAFLIDASVFPGSSGSPVVLLPWNSGGVTISVRPQLLGIVASVFYREDTGRIEMAEIPAKQLLVSVTRQMIDLGVVFKAPAILDCIAGIIASHESPAETV